MVKGLSLVVLATAALCNVSAAHLRRGLEVVAADDSKVTTTEDVPVEGEVAEEDGDVATYEDKPVEEADDKEEEAVEEPVEETDDAEEEDTTEDDGPDDVTILQLALNLEYLEAEFYSWAAFGYGLEECADTTIGGEKAHLSEGVQAYAQEIAKSEKAHVRFLQKALESIGKSVRCPKLDIGPAFAAAANAAVGSTLDPPYTPYFDDKWFLLGAFIFEDVGVTAYGGALRFFDNKDYLEAASRIHAVEAYHAGLVRTLLTQVKDQELTPYPLTVAAGVEAVSKLRAAVGGGNDKDITTEHKPFYYTKDGEKKNVLPSQIVAADENSLAYIRSVEEVLNIVYLGSAATPGGFFPDGINLKTDSEM